LSTVCELPNRLEQSQPLNLTEWIKNCWVNKNINIEEKNGCGVTEVFELQQIAGDQADNANGRKPHENAHQPHYHGLQNDEKSFV
jgi:hypothetical protein